MFEDGGSIRQQRSLSWWTLFSARGASHFPAAGSCSADGSSALWSAWLLEQWLFYLGPQPYSSQFDWDDGHSLASGSVDRSAEH